MRSLASIAGLGTLLLAGGAFAQTLSEHAAAAAGATIGTAAGKPISNALAGIMGSVNDATATAAKTGAKAKVVTTTVAPTDPSAQTNRGAGPGSFSPGFGSDGGASAGVVASEMPQEPRPVVRRRSAPLRAVPAPVIAPTPVVAAEPVKEPSLEEVASVKLGTSEKELFILLGTPESRVIVPDDDGHMKESCQYWAQGRQLGTIRLDNGQVVRVDVIAGN